VRANLEQLEEISGNPIPRLCAGGGMTRSETFCQVLADVIDRPLRVASTPQTSALGAAMLAAVTLGLRLSLEDAIEHMCGTRRDVAPRLAAAAAYDDYYARWRALCEQMEQSAATA